MKGYSLIEIVVSLSIVLITLVIFGVAVSTIPLTKSTDYQNTAYHIAAKKIEELRNTPYASLPTSGPFTDPGLSQLPSSSASLIISDYSGSSEIKQVTATVSWDDGSAPKSTQLETLIIERGLGQN